MSKAKGFTAHAPCHVTRKYSIVQK